MSRVVPYMAMSLDGFITGPGRQRGEPGRNGGHATDAVARPGRPAVSDWRPHETNSRLVFDEMMTTGAVITDRRTGDFGGYWGGDHHDGVPIFVPTHHPPPKTPYYRVHFVTDGVHACVDRAKSAAGDRDVMLHGYTAQECLKAGVLDVLEIQLMPVLLGRGRRLFDRLDPEHIELDLVRTLEAPAVLHLRYEVRRA